MKCHISVMEKDYNGLLPISPYKEFIMMEAVVLEVKGMAIE